MRTPHLTALCGRDSHSSTYGRGGTGACSGRKPKGRCEPLRCGFLNSPIARIRGQHAIQFSSRLLSIDSDVNDHGAGQCGLHLRLRKRRRSVYLYELD